MKLIKFSDNYADEFDVEGFKIMSNEMWNEWKDYWQHVFEEAEENDDYVEWYFGTNEPVIYEDGFDSFLLRFTVIDISLRRAEHIELSLGKSLGFFPE